MTNHNEFAIPAQEKMLVSSIVALNGSEDRVAMLAMLKEAIILCPTPEYPEQILNDPKYQMILRAALSMAADGIIPTPELVAQFSKAKGYHPLEDPEAVRREVAEARGDKWHFDPAIPLWAMRVLLPETAGERVSRKVFEKAIDVIQSGVGTYADRYARASQLIQEASPRVNNVTVLTAEQADQQYLGHLDARAAQEERGIPRMTFPKEFGLSRLVPEVMPGQATLFHAGSGYGKTSVATQWADHLAMIGKGFFTVLYFHAENLPVNMSDRRMARYGGFPIEELRRGLHKAEVIEIQKRLSPWAKSMIYVHCPGVSPETIVQTVRQFASRLPDVDHRLIFMVDYVDLYKLDLRGAGNQSTTEKLAWAMEMFKTTAEQCSFRTGFKGGVHSVFIMQENKEGDPFASNQGRFKCQVGLKMHRKRAAETYRLDATDENGDPIWVKKGEYAPVVRLEITKANDDRTGISTCFFEGKRYRIAEIVDDSAWDSIRELKEQKRSYYAD